MPVAILDLITRLTSGRTFGQPRHTIVNDILYVGKHRLDARHGLRTSVFGDIITENREERFCRGNRFLNPVDGIVRCQNEFFLTILNSISAIEIGSPPSDDEDRA